MLDPLPGRTAHEAAEASARRLPSCADDLRAAGRLFDDVAYGDLEADATAYRWLARGGPAGRRDPADGAVGARARSGGSAVSRSAVSDTVRIGGEPPATAAARRWRRWRMPVLAASLLAVSVMFAALIQPDLSSEPLAVDNPGDDGARAVAQVLGHQGVRVTATHDLGTAVARATAGTTLAVVTTSALDGAALLELARTDGRPGRWSTPTTTRCAP